MYPFIACELSSEFNFNKSKEYGFLPIVLKSKDPDKVLKTYISLYIREEILMEGLVRNIGNFSRFLEAISFSQGAILNISNIARESGVERKVIENYISILEDLLLYFRIPVFKFYFFDCGVFKSLRPSGPLDKAEEIAGGVLEGMVA